MAELTLNDFSGFFAALNDGHTPYAWQSEMVQRWGSGTPPQRVAAPTGTGKSSLIEMHVFLRALAIQNGGSHPRRLVLTVGRRALVDSQAARARAVAEALADAEDAILRQVADLLRRDRPASSNGAAPPPAPAAPLEVSVMRGGMEVDSSWLEDPLGCRIMCVTPDLLGSRLLFRGYLASRPSWPRHAGLLAHDTMIVVDESHLNRQLVTTLRRIKKFASTSPLASHVPAMELLETTATPPPTDVDQLTVGADAIADPALAPRLTAAKTLRLTTLPALPLPKNGKDRQAGIERIVESAAAMRTDTGGTIGVLLNRVRDALKVAADLRERGLTVVTLVGPMRPHDRRALEEEYPTLLTPAGDDRVDVLVATQTLEVGIDLDLHGMVTELAPAPSLVQRWGRVNRQGLRDHATIEVLLAPEAAKLDGTQPYEPGDLEAAAAWLRDLGDGADVSPAALAGMTIPPAALRRLLETRLSRTHATLLSHGSETPVAQPDLEFWLADSLDPERPMVQIVGRRLPTDPAAAAELVAVTPPAADEQYPTTMATAKAVLREVAGAGSVPFGVLVRAGVENRALPMDELVSALAPGDILVLSHHLALAIEGVVAERDVAEKGVSARVGLGDVSDRYPQSHDDVAFRVVIDPDPWGENTSLSASQEASADLLEAVADVVTEIEEERRDAADRAALRGKSAPGDLPEATWDEVQKRLGSSVSSTWRRELGAPHATTTSQDSETPSESPTARRLEPTLLVPAVAGPNGRYPWVAVAWRPAESVTAEELQEFSPKLHKVALDDHQRDVAERARLFAEGVGLPADLVDALTFAGAHHDDGKKHMLFQRDRLGRLAGEPLLAKSGDPAARTPRRRARTGLPSGWRHEQLSAVLTWDLAQDHPHRELITRLVGTSHGRGRVDFPHMDSALRSGEFPDSAASAAALFDGGVWDEIIARTDAGWGPWGTAYLEALLRAADTTVSGEGH